jgi:6,7-dimethyl-8-ribityllumazine synthase
MARAQEMRQPTARLAAGVKLACVVSRYHEEITGAMRDSAVETLRAAGLEEADLVEARVPGAFELPLVALRLALRRDVAAVLCFGLVLRGETEHNTYIGHAVAQGLMQAGLTSDTPILFGVLTCDTLEQATERARRAGEGGLDKGREVALAAIEVLAALESAGGQR